VNIFISYPRECAEPLSLKTQHLRSVAALGCAAEGFWLHFKTVAFGWGQIML
jgi:hypothetical protein